MKLKPVIERWATFVLQLAEDRYGHAPEIRISGHVNSKFPYIGNNHAIKEFDQFVQNTSCF